MSMSKQGSKKCWVEEKIQNDTVGFHLVITCQILIYFQSVFVALKMERADRSGESPGSPNLEIMKNVPP